MDECDLDLKQMNGVGMGAPGSVDAGAGRVIFAPNLQWEDVPLKKILEKQLGGFRFRWKMIAMARRLEFSRRNCNPNRGT